MAAVINKDGYEFLECIQLNEHKLIHYTLLAGSYAVVRFDGRYLLCFNTRRRQWEVPVGGRDDSETTKECAIRELVEETAQVVQDTDFIGLLKVRKPDGTIKFNRIKRKWRTFIQ
ncbi:NUDIX hydrolase [Paenibacillus sp. LHD-117]|uniref:NUDIX hydrolase n=1 Tax=Paenibacillus sp. LHD-117 TaxID=3071412 RepID=UPI0027DED09A|nr:NUDIX hydrolase [Paenibacillus sp. LHD-117]MDQ6420479.1 NUDIX hydrolase [Paenibacillus sp. LHD-117]